MRVGIEAFEDRVVINVDWMDVERVVYTDGRGHPEDGDRTIQGHSIGEWDGDVLAIETTQRSQEPQPKSPSQR